MANMEPEEASAVPPTAQLLGMMFGKAQTNLLFMAATLGIADLLKGGPKSVEELASDANAHAPSLRRALHALARMGVFAETEPERFTQTPLSELLRSDSPSSLKGMVLMTGSGWHNRMWEHVLESVQTGKSYWENRYQLDFYEYLRQHPADQHNLAEAMASLSRLDAMAVCATYDFTDIRTVVDVGGGTGYFLSEILKANPKLRGILFDQPPVVDLGRPHIKTQALDNRCEVVGGDFFASVPRAGDAYTIKGVLFNWDDERAGKILTCCREAMNSAGRVLVIEPVMSKGNGSSPSTLLDIEMLVGCSGGRVRSEAEFQTLFKRTDFKLQRILPMPSAYSIVEGVPA
jgi:hypothetical protein